jgi:hypothetical protein
MFSTLVSAEFWTDLNDFRRFPPESALPSLLPLFRSFDQTASQTRVLLFFSLCRTEQKLVEVSGSEQKTSTVESRRSFSTAPPPRSVYSSSHFLPTSSVLRWSKKRRSSREGRRKKPKREKDRVREEREKRTCESLQTETRIRALLGDTYDVE